MDRSTQINTFSRFTQVSRETISSLIKYEEILINANKSLNLVGNSTISQIWNRHFLDSMQVIDFINKNDKSVIDLGSGAGFPGIVLSIIAKDRKIDLKITLVEKSSKKIIFLEKIKNQLNLDIKILHQNVLKEKFKINDDVIVSRAFKPLKIILELIHKKAKNWKKIFIFLGKTGREELVQASKIWDMEYKQRVSVTNVDSVVLEINGLKKK
tara:strand:- start:230 stop:865 length:636 start_codon:yes stop_codon:yes gene_type:complete